MITSTNVPSRLSEQVRPSSGLRPSSNLYEHTTEQNNANNAVKYAPNSLASSGVGPNENAFSQRHLDTSGFPNPASPWPCALDSERNVPNSSEITPHSQLQNLNIDMATRVGEPTSQRLWSEPSKLYDTGTSNTHNFTSLQTPRYNPTLPSQYPGGTNNGHRHIENGTHRNAEDQRNGYLGSTMLNMNHRAQITSQPMHPFHPHHNHSIMATARVSDVAAQPNFGPQTGMHNPRVINQGHWFPFGLNTQATHPTQWLNPREVNFQHSSTGKPNPSRIESFQNVANDNTGHITANLGNNARTAFETQPRVDGIWPQEIPHSNSAMFHDRPGMTVSNGMPMLQSISASHRFNPNPFAITSQSDKHEISCGRVRVVRPRKRRGRPLKSVRPSTPPSPKPTVTSSPPNDLQKTSPFILCKDGTFSCQYRGAAVGPFGCGAMGIIGEDNKDCHMSVHAFGEEQMLQEKLLNPDRVWALLWTRKIRETCPEPGCGFSEVAWRMERVLERHRKEEHTDEADETHSDSEEDEDEDEDEDEEWE